MAIKTSINIGFSGVSEAGGIWGGFDPSDPSAGFPGIAVSMGPGATPGTVNNGGFKSTPGFNPSAGEGLPNFDLGGTVDFGGFGGFFDLIGGRDPRPTSPGVLGPIGAVGPPRSLLDQVSAAIKAAMGSGNFGKIIAEQIANVPRDANGVPIVERAPGVPADPVVDVPGATDPGDVFETEPVVDVPGAVVDPPVVEPPVDDPVFDPPVVEPPPGTGEVPDTGSGDTPGEDDGDSDEGEGDEPLPPEPPPTTDPETGDTDMPDFFDFGIGIPGSENQFSSAQAEQSNLLLDPQRQLIESLLPQFQTLANQQGQQIGQIAPGLSASLGARGGGFLNQLGQGQNPFLQQLAGFQGQNQAPQTFGGQGTFEQLAQGGGALGQIAAGQNQFQQQLASTGPNEFLQPAIDNLGADINRQLQRQNVGIGQAATSAGARGGSRQGVAEGIAQEGALNAFTTQAGQLRAQDAAQQRQLQQTGQLGALQAQLQGGQLQQGGQLAGASGLQGGGQFNASLAQQAQQQGLAGLLGASSGQNQLGGINQSGAGIGLGSLGGLFNLGLGQFGAQRSPFEALAGLFDPVKEGLGRSASSGASSSVGGFTFDLAI